jgi:hypothetical protein
VVAAPANRYAPSDRPRIALAADGSLAAICERTRIVITELPSCAELSELALDTAATEVDHAWIGTPPRLLVLSRYDGRCTIHLVDPFGPRAITELQLEAPLRLCASVGNHALAIGPQGAAILAATDVGLTPFPFPARAIPTTAGAAGTQFVVALAGAIEEWDPVSRLPKRRLKLSRPAQVRAVGGSARIIWFTTEQEPSRIDVIPIVARGQPKAHDLPEPIAHVASHPRSDLLVCVGATSGRVWVVDLDGRTGLRMVGPEGIDRVEAAGLVVGRTTGVLAAQTHRPLAVIPLERGEVDSHAHEPDTTVTSNAGQVAAAPPAVSSPAGSPPAAPPPAPRTRSPSPPPPPVAAARARMASSPPLDAPAPRDAAFTSFRDRVAHPRARTIDAPQPLWSDAPQSWRDDLIEWTRAASSTPPSTPPIEALLTRYDLTPALAAPLALLYAAHLLGEAGVAPADIARLAGWPEALGRGELADKHCTIHRDSRVLLAPALRRVLDELAPATGTMIGMPGVVSLLGPCTIVAAGPLTIIAEACASSIGGAILAAHDGVDPHALVDEARAYGAAPMVRITAATLAHVPLDQPIILVADDDRTADQLGLPRLT